MRKKRILSIVLILALLLNLLPSSLALAVDPSDGDFTFDSATGTITSYNGAGGIVVIPDDFLGVPITGIGDRAFNQKNNVTRVVIPDGVTSIGTAAFSDCAELISVRMPDTVLTIGDGSFSNNPKLNTIKLSSGLTAIPDRAFVYSGLESIEMPDSIEVIGEMAFFGNSALKISKLPANLKIIKKQAFYWCDRLSGIVIPAGVTTIEDKAFSQQGWGRNLTQVVIQCATAPVLQVVAPDTEPYVFDTPTANGNLKIYYPQTATGFSNPWHGYNTEAYDADATYNVNYHINTEADVVEPDPGHKTGDIHTVRSGGLFGVDNLRFYCWNTKADGTGIDYMPGDDLVVLNKNMELYAQWLYPVTVDVTGGHGTVKRNVSGTLKNFDYGKSGSDMYLEVVPDIGYHIKAGSLYYSEETQGYQLDTNSFVMPASPVTLSVEFEEGEYTFDKATGTIFDYNGAGGNIVIPSMIDGVAVKRIGAGAFCDDHNVVNISDTITSVVVPNGVESIGNAAFARCTNLKSIVLPDSLKEISGIAFAECESLVSVMIPSSVTTIRDNTFADCTSLKIARFEGNGPTTAGVQIFSSCDPEFKMLYHTGKNLDASTLSGYTKVAMESGDGAGIIALDMAAVDVILSSGDTKDRVTKNVHLPNIGPNGSKLTWQSSTPEVIKEDGTVIRPNGAIDYAVQLSVLPEYGGGGAMPKNIILTVPTTANRYTVTFDKNGGTTEPNPVYLHALVTKPLGSLPAPPTKTGYLFAGWNTAADGSGTAFTATTPVNGDMTVYALWTSVPVVISPSVTFDKNGGDTEAAPKLVMLIPGTQSVSLPTPPTRKGFVFSGWNTAANGSGTAYTAAIPVANVLGNLTLYAQWTAVTVPTPTPSGGGAVNDRRGSTGVSSGGGGAVAGSGSVTPVGPTSPTATSVPAGTTTSNPNTNPSGSLPSGTFNGTSLGSVAEVSSGQVNGVQTTTYTFDSGRLANALQAPPTDRVVAVSSGTEALRTVFSGGDIMALANQDISLRMNTLSGSYDVPFNTIDLRGVTSHLGMTGGNDAAALGGLSFEMSITRAGSEADAAMRTAQAEGLRVISSPVEFRITCQNGSSSTLVENFNTYVSRSIVVPNDAVIDGTITALVLEPNGDRRPVPTRIETKDGVSRAVINSRTNSTYVLVTQKAAFKDIKGIPEEKAILSMAERMIMEGKAGKFGPKQDVTRAEFVTGLVKALGLKKGTMKSPYTDVKDTSSYAGFIKAAYENKLLLGNGKFRPNDTITKEEAMNMIAAATSLTGLKTTLEKGESDKLLAGFKDRKKLGKASSQNAAVCMKLGLFSMTKGNLSGAKAQLNKAEMATVLQELLKKSGLI